MCSGTLFGNYSAENPLLAKPAKDLNLTPSELRHVNALAHFAWGSYLALNDAVDNTEIADEYIASIKNNPESDYLIRELLYLWAGDSISTQNSNVVKHLSKIAREDPKLVNLNLLVSNAYIYRKEYKTAEKHLKAVFKEIKWSEPLIIKDLSYCYLHTKQYKKLHKLLRTALSDNNLKGNFTVEYCAAVSYSTVAAGDDTTLSKKMKGKFFNLGIFHAINASESFDPNKNFKNTNEILILAGLLIRQNLVPPAIKLLNGIRKNGWRTPEFTIITDEYLTVDYYLTLAAMYYALNKKDEIIPTLKKAIQLDPGNSEANNFLGYYLAEEKKDFDKAEKLIRQALTKEPNNAAYIDSLAWVLYRKGKYKKAAANILKAIALQKENKDGIILDHAGDIYHALGDTNKALVYWEEALNYNIESSKEVKEKIKSLKK